MRDALTHSDQAGLRAFVKVAADRITHLNVEFSHRRGLREDRLPDRTRGQPAFRRIFDHEYDFVHEAGFYRSALELCSESIHIWTHHIFDEAHATDYLPNSEYFFALPRALLTGYFLALSTSFSLLADMRSMLKAWDRRIR